MARQRNWDTLSDKYRKRLTGQGVTKESYESGTANLAKARGHGSKAKENARRKLLRTRKQYVAEILRLVPELDDDIVNAVLDTYLTPPEIEDRIQWQNEMATLYASGNHDRAKELFQMRSDDFLPYWILAYHRLRK